MAARLRQSAFVRTALTAVVAAFALAAGADSAYATCGDYLSHGFGGTSAAGDQMPSAALPADGRDSHLPVCQDGSCRHGIPRDVPPPPQTRVGGDHWACPLSRDLAADRPSAMMVQASEPSPLSPCHAALFRPPRVS
jgi:hypothetical protein